MSLLIRPTNETGLTLIFGDGAAEIALGVKGYLSCPFSGVITYAELEAKEGGDIVVDVWKAPYADYPPTVADSICGASKPNLVADWKYKDFSLIGWTTSIAKGDIFGFNVDSVSGITQCTITLSILKI
jgi:hypothetical protein